MSPTQFDPPASGVSPSYLTGRQDSLAIGGTGTSRKLLVRYNYGYLVYSLAVPAAPVKIQTKDLLGEERYPKTGDGQTRATALSVSGDGQRAVQGWGNEGGWGTVALGLDAVYSGGGDFAPAAKGVWANTVVKSGTRYLSIVSTLVGTSGQLWVADLTTLRSGVTASDATKNSIPSEKVVGPDLGGTVKILKAVDGANAAYVVAASADRVTVLNVSNVGTAVPNLSTGFTHRTYTLAELGLTSGTVRSAAAVLHPLDSSLHLLVEAAGPESAWSQSTGVSLVRIDPSTRNAQVLGTVFPPTGARKTQAASLLLAVDTDVVAVFLESLDAGGLALHVHAGIDFSQNLATGVTFSNPATIGAIAGFRPSGGTIHLYLGRLSEGVYAASLDCPTAPSPAVAALSAEKIPATGAAVSIPDNGTVFVGDEVRIKPAFSPPDNVKPVVDWRLDYDYHGASPAPDYGAATPFVAMSDLPFSAGGPFPSTLTLLGPCDPAKVPDGGGAPVPSTGVGCWTSVTTNGANTATGNPDFATDQVTGDPAPGLSVPLTVAFEVRNALNESGSSLAKHRINWKVPRALLKSTAMLTGGSLANGSEGTPATTGFRWYVSSVPVGQTGDDVLNLLPACTGSTCAPGLTQRGTYRYWVTVPYRNGFRTPECPGLSGTTCAGEATKTIDVTDVVLGFTVPATTFVGAPAMNVASSSVRGTVYACGGTSGFTYDRCAVAGGDCPEGDYSDTGLAPVGDPFNGGKLTVPTPAQGSWGLRFRYTYSTTAGDCSSPTTASWPAAGAAQAWAPVTVSTVQPHIVLMDPSGGKLCFGSSCEIYTGSPGGRAYVYVDNGSGGLVQDPTPPAISWSFGNNTSGSGQGASFSYTSAGTYTITLNGYGAPATQQITASVQPTGGGGTGGSGGALAVSSITFSKTSPAVGESVTIACNATGGQTPYTEYFFSFGDSASQATTSKSISHQYQTEGYKSVGCTVTDKAASTAQKVTTLLVVAGTGTSCDFSVKNSAGARLQADPVSKRFDVASGQQLTFEAVGTTGSVSWNFGNGQSASGNPVNYTFNNPGSTYQAFTVTMTATSCSKAYGFDVAPPAGPTFAVTDADTGTSLARTGGALEARAGQRLKFTASNATGAVSWTFGDGETSAEASPVKTYAPLVDQTFVVILTANAQSAQDSIAVKGSTGAPLTGNYTFKYADGTAVTRSAVQPNKAILFTAVDQATSYQWDFGDGSPLSQGSPKEYTFLRGGTFTVSLTTARAGLTPVASKNPATLTVLPPPDPLLWVAAGMAYASGSKGELFQSDLSIYNPGTSTSTVSLGFVAGSGWDGASKVEWRPRALVAGETLSFTNVLSSFFGLDKGSWGVVLIRGDDVPVSPIIVSRTYNAANADETGTFGLSVPAMSVAAGVKPQSAAAGSFLAGLRHDASFRTNLTIANLKAETAVVEVVFRDGSGNVLGVPARFTIESRGVKQLNSALSAAPATGTQPIGGAGYSADASSFSAEVQLKQGSGVFPYATIIDGGTGDSIVVAPAPRPSTTYRLPGIVRVKGKNGPFWVSDVAVLNPSAKERKVRINYSYVRSGTTLRINASQSVPLAPYEMKVGIDFVRVWLGLSEDDTFGYSSSYVDISPADDDTAKTEPLVVTGKTYTPSGAGSIGLQVDPFVYEDGIGAQASRKRMVLPGLEANQSYRTNVALFLTPGSTGNAQVDVHVLDSFGRESKKFSGIGLDSDNPFVQLSSSDLFAGLTTTDSARATVVIDNPRGSALVGAYATAIDERSEDAIFIAGQPAP